MTVTHETALPETRTRLPDSTMLDDALFETSTGGTDRCTDLPPTQARRDSIIELLNDSLATELVCELRYKRHYFTSESLVAPKIAEEFLGYANEESLHADRLARRIVQIGGQPDYSPDSLARRSFVDYDDSCELEAMISADLAAERIVIERFLQIIRQIGDSDPTTRQLLQDILSDEEDQAEELKEWLDD